MAGEGEKVGQRQDVEKVGPPSKRKGCTHAGPSMVLDRCTTNRQEEEEDEFALVEAADKTRELDNPAASSEDEDDEDDEERKYLMPPGLAQIYINLKYEDPNPPESDYGSDEEAVKRCLDELGPFCKEEKMDPDFLDRVEREFNQYGYVLVGEDFFAGLDKDRADCQDMMDRLKKLSAAGS